MFRHTSASALSNFLREGLKGDAIIAQADHGAEVKTTRRIQSGKCAGSIHIDDSFLRIYAAAPRAETSAHWETAGQTLYFGVHYPKRLHCACASTEPANKKMYDTCIAIVCAVAAQMMCGEVGGDVLTIGTYGYCIYRRAHKQTI